jgi:quinol monooxygenase YgiN
MPENTNHPSSEGTFLISTPNQPPTNRRIEAKAREVMRTALQDTRAFDGNLGTDVLVDEDDEAHWLVYERWDTVGHDEAYRAFRASEGRITELPALLAAPPVKTRYTTTDV